METIELTHTIINRYDITYTLINANKSELVYNGLAKWYLMQNICPYCLKKISTIGNFTIELNNLCTCKKS